MEGVSPTWESYLEYHALKKMALRYQICHVGLAHEIPLIQMLFASNCKTVLQFLMQNYRYKLAFDCLYNIMVIPITFPIITSSCEGCLSKLKPVETFLRTSMCHDRFSQLTLLSIKSNRAQSIDLGQFVDEFDSRYDNHRIKSYLTDWDRTLKTT